jgi:hypothetical protein
VQWELAETYGVSQATISRAITAITPLLARALARYVPTAEELRPDRQYIVDGTLLPCWSWASESGLYCRVAGGNFTPRLSQIRT